MYVCIFILDVDSEIQTKMTKEEGIWLCTDCSYHSSQKGHVYEHIEAKHVVHSGYRCQICDKVLKTSASYRMHFKRCQSQQNQ